MRISDWSSDVFSSDLFFQGSPNDPRNGTEEIITSYVSEAWPVSDAAVGGYTYALEILTGIIGSRMRWRSMPWLVLLFGLMIAPNWAVLNACFFRNSSIAVTASGRCAWISA